MAQKTLYSLLFALLLTGIIGLHNHYFNGHQYRQDEAWDVHSALERDLAGNVVLRAISIHPPGWYILADVWVGAFGDSETMTRLLSAFLTAITLALVFRLGADLFDWQVGLLAVFLLGTNLFFLVNSHEFRPYAALITAVVASQWALLRWLRQPKFIYALLFVISSIGCLYFHYFGVFIVLAQALYCLLLVHWNRGLLMRGGALFLLAGLSFSAWLLPWLHSILVATNNGISYAVPNDWWVLVDFHRQLSQRPVELSNLLLLSGLLLPLTLIPSAPKTAPFRFGNNWPRIALVFIPVTATVLAFAVNSVVSHLIIRNMVVILPYAALIAALTLWALPRSVRIVALLLLLLPALQQPFGKDDNLLRLSASLSTIYEPEAKIVLEGAATQFLAQFGYYIERRLPEIIPKERMFYVAAPNANLDILPAPPIHYARGAAPEQLAKLAEFVATAQEVWYVRVPQYAVDPAFQAVLEDDFMSVRRYPHTTRYIRKPENLNDLYVFGDTYQLQHWALRGEVTVQPCQIIEMESWWQTDKTPAAAHVLSLVLANTDGLGVARDDRLPADLETPFWEPGQLYFDERALTIPCDLPPGAYNLLLSFYPLGDTTALPVTFPDGTPTSDQVYFTTIFVE